MKEKLSILVADDDAAHGRMLRALLENWGYVVEVVGDGAEAVRLGRELPVDLALLDVRMPVMDGLEALKQLHEARPSLPVLMMTAWSDVPAAVEAIKSGAWDYLAKPLDFERLKVSLRNVFAHANLMEENAALSRRLAEGGGRGGILGQSAPMRGLWEMIRTIAPSEATVLVSGESGTGKELVARAVHDLSHRAGGPFVAANCGAFTETLLASELFGHEKGAFTGADHRHEGLFVRAKGGTLFLDEVGELPLAMQVKLLRVLQEREVLRVGGTRPEAIDVRVIAATNRDLAQETIEGRFREDLYYRLNVVTLTMPPLRDRGGDIELLARHFATRFAQVNHKRVAGITPQALDILTCYAWPGNVRELENVMERAVILMPGEYIDVRELPERLLRGSGQAAIVSGKAVTGGGEAGATDGGGREEATAKIVGTGGGRLPTLEEVERAVILRTLQRCSGNKSETARILGITRKTLHARLNRYGGEDALLDAGQDAEPEISEQR